MSHAFSIVDGKVSDDDRRRLTAAIGAEMAEAAIAEEEARYAPATQAEEPPKKPRRTADPSPQNEE